MKITGIFDKQYLIRRALYTLCVLLGVGLIVYFAYHVHNRFTTELELLPATLKTVTRTITADAYIMRDETPLYARSSASGSVAPAVRDGGRIALYQKIADVYANASPDTESRLAEIDEQITLLEKNQAADRSVQSTIGLDSSIYDSLYTLRSHCASGDYAEALSHRTGLLVTIKKRAILTGEITDYAAQITKLEQEKASLKSTLGACLETIYSSSTGYYFSDYDGYGTVFSSKQVDTMTYDDFSAMTQAEAEPVNSLCIGTMVKDFRWYIACRISKAEAAELKEIGQCTVNFTYSGESVDMKLHRIIPETPGDRAVVLFVCEKMPVNFDYTRMQPVAISSVQYTGYEIPLSAVRVLHGYEGVYTAGESDLEFKRIHIIYRKDDTVLCTGSPYTGEEEDGEKDDEIYPWIQRNDFIVVSGRELYAGKLIK